jgi:hypothetical protein
MQWWRGTGYQPSTLQWHRFCTFMTERFAITSLCENVKAFHALTQTSTASNYITQFESNMNLMRRDNPALPNNYFVKSFISGLTAYLQSHVEVQKPTTMQ